ERSLEKTNGRSHARTLRNKTLVHAQLLAQARSMKGCSTTKSDHDVLGDILAVLHRMDTCRISHILIHYLDNAKSSGLRSELQLIAPSTCKRCVVIRDRRLDLPAGEIVGTNFAHHEVRIGIGRSFAATLVTGWSRLGSRRFWANLNTPHGIDPGDRTTARTAL